MRIFCDFGKSDYRPEYQGGLKCELRDEEGQVVAAQAFPFGGAVPKSEWITLPADATIRLRSSPFGIHRPGALAIAPDVGTQWIIPDGDRTVYKLSGKFTAERAHENQNEGEERDWQGTLELPAVRLTGRMGE